MMLLLLLAAAPLAPVDTVLVEPAIQGVPAPEATALREALCAAIDARVIGPVAVSPDLPTARTLGVRFIIQVRISPHGDGYRLHAARQSATSDAGSQVRLDAPRAHLQRSAVALVHTLLVTDDTRAVAPVVVADVEGVQVRPAQSAAPVNRHVVEAPDDAIEHVGIDGVISARFLRTGVRYTRGPLAGPGLTYGGAIWPLSRAFSFALHGGVGYRNPGGSLYSAVARLRSWPGVLASEYGYSVRADWPLSKWPAQLSIGVQFGQSWVLSGEQALLEAYDMTSDPPTEPIFEGGFGAGIFW